MPLCPTNYVGTHGYFGGFRQNKKILEIFLTLGHSRRLTKGLKEQVIDFLSLARDAVQINFEQYIDNVFRFALSLTGDRYLAEDLTQECFLRAHQRQKQLQSDTATKSWLFQILVNLWKDHLKKKHVKVIESVDLEFMTNNDRPEDKSIGQEERDQIIRMMLTLPNQQRTILFLCAVEQLSIREIASLLKSSENSVKANLSVARKTMRKKILELSKNEQAET